jgi:teichuronic acid biosynthesis glycosyltransferase TuaG
VISVIIPAYNAASTIQDTVNSVLAQTCGDWELLVVNDGSTDDTVRVTRAAARKDRRVTVISRENQGVSAARNAALREAAGRFVAFLDADDAWMPRKLELQLKFMLENASAFSFTGYRRFTDSWLGPVTAVPRYVDYRTLLKSRPIKCSSVMIDRKVVSIRMPDLGRSSGHEDLMAWLALLKSCSADGLNEDLLRFRIRPGSRSYNKVEGAKNVWRVYRRHERLNFFPAAWYFSHYAVNAVRSRVIASVS